MNPRSDIVVHGRDWFRVRQGKDEFFVAEYEVGFFGTQWAVLLSRSSDPDNYVWFQLAYEDDEKWHLRTDGTTHTSFHWAPDLMAQLVRAREWVDKNCTVSRYGWTFPPKENPGE